MRRPRFELSKWYLDCVSPEGDAVVAYSADLRWRSVKLGYQSALVLDAAGTRSTATSLRRHAPPAISGPRASWKARALGIDAEWQGRTPAVRETIFRSEAGTIDWNCHLPSADCRLSIGDRNMRGDGYVEHIRMTIAPWLLPLTTLRWGRIAAGGVSIVWIEAHLDSAPLVWLNGSRVACSGLDDDGLLLGDGTKIDLAEKRVLRQGALGTTALASVPGLKKLAPARMLAANECKWVSRATVSMCGCKPVQAWAIHEVVEWPR